MINVDAAVTNAGATVLEVLEKSPGVTVDRNGGISLQAKSGVLVYIDGIQTFLTGADLANLLLDPYRNRLLRERARRDPVWIWPEGILGLRDRAYGEGRLWYGRAAGSGRSEPL